ncbi:MAG: translocation/assembly module TamB domain-containing protein, partial [Vicinamibacterales bacterium]
IDTEAEPFQYRGEGRLEHVDLHRFGEALDIDWLREPRYAGTLDGDFHVDGAGAELASLTLVGGGRLFRAQMFGGELSNADVSIAIANGSLEGGYDGQLARIDPAIALDDGRYSATLTGSGRGRISVRDLFLRDPQLDDYTIDAALTLRDSSVRGFDDVEGRFQGRLAGGTLVLEELAVSSPAVALDATGTFELASARSSHVEFDISRGDLARLEEWSGQRLQGGFTSKGVLTGPWDALRVAGDLTLTNVAGPGVTALGGTLAYSAAIPTEAPARTDGRLDGTFSFVRAFGRELPEVTAALRYDAGRITTHIGTSLSERVDLGVEGGGDLDVAAGTFRIDALTIDASPGAWRLAPSAAPRVSWTDAEVRVEDLRLIDAAGESSSLSVAGTWRPAGGGALHVQATGVSIDALTAQPGVPARWGGTADVTAELTGSNARPLIDATFQVVNGRVRRLAYDRFGGQVRYGDEVAEIDVRLDQAPGVWLTAVGRVPRWTLAPDEAADRPHADDTMRVEVHSSRVALGLIEGVTDVVRNVSGAVLLNVTVVGTAKDPHFEGAVDVSDAAFEVVASGARYQHGRLALQLATDRVDVEALHLEDQQGHPLDITGSLATHELKVQDLRVAITARTFQVLRNEYGEVDINADLTFRGEFESPRLEGRIALTGGSIAVDRILDRTLSQPYSTQEGSLPEFDPLAVLNPWERMGMDVSLSIPGTLRMIGENVQVAGAPLGLGDFNLRAIGDLYLYKDPAQPLYVTGSFDSVTGTYAFQGRRFELDPNSSINFRGDVFPELYVMVRREISAVETRITISGTIREPELILASTPPLEPSDILSLIVFNTSTNDLSALQQQQLAVRAGTIAAGFLAAPMLGALERSLGIDTLEIEPGADVRGGPRVTIGNEIAPGLVARFSRQFGPAEYSEAVIEYYLSRVLSLRARFSDAGTLAARSPFRRIERAGIDLLVFFSF